MRQKEAQTERGQIIILMVAAIVALLGFAALAIDGGTLYFDRRRAQSSADAASLAGAAMASQYMKIHNIGYENFPCSSSVLSDTLMTEKIEEATIHRAQTDDFDIDNDHTDHNGLWITCNNGENTARSLDVNVEITTQTKTSFIHFVFPGIVKNTVFARARIWPESPFGYGKTIIALDKQYCSNSGNQGGLFIDGNSVVNIKGGMISNTCFDDNGSVTVNVTNESGTGPGSITYDPDWPPDHVCDPTHVTPCPQPSSPPVTRPNQPEPFCNPDWQPKQNISGPITLNPGSYRGLKVSGSGDILKLNPGLYCFNEDFTATSGIVTVAIPPGGTLDSGNIGVTIYMTEGANFKINTGTPGLDPNDATVTLVAPREKDDCLSATYYKCLQGILLYMSSTSGSVQIEGNSQTRMIGVVYAPDSSVDIGGNDDSTSYAIQIIGKSIKVHGNVTLNFNNNSIPPEPNPSTLEQNK